MFLIYVETVACVVLVSPKSLLFVTVYCFWSDGISNLLFDDGIFKGKLLRLKCGAFFSGKIEVVGASVGHS